ncbi:MAG: threonine/serine dehydratase [Nitratireductor sp.]|nr:threonine/serine dehydratase [Nitratireductor sp.]
MLLPAFADIEAAASRLSGRALRTPLLRSAELDSITGARVFVKAECLQLTGSFKFRGAFNAASALSENRPRGGVVACSSGNHAQGVAEAARLLGMKATIVMPSDAPAIKVARTRRSGAEVILYDRDKEDRDAIANGIVERTGAHFIHPYENPFVIAGQGTCGLEIAQDLAAMGLSADRVIVCCGGGGLTAGVALAVHSRFPQAVIHTAEPAGFDDYARSLAAGSRLTNERLSGSACDALLTPSPGELSFAVNREHVHSGFAVSDEEAFAAMRLAFAELKIVVEPGGAVALAALLAQGKAFAGETVVCVASGGNVDPELYARVLTAGK